MNLVDAFSGKKSISIWTQPHRPGEGALTDRGKESDAEIGVKVTVRGQGEWQGQGNCRGGVAEPRYVTVRGSGRAKVCNCPGEWQSQGM